MIFCNIALLSFSVGYIIGVGSYMIFFNIFNIQDDQNEMSPMNMGPVNIEEMER